jgi:hypothetical protein
VAVVLSPEDGSGFRVDKIDIFQRKLEITVMRIESYL